jgi:hypothetical protein
MGAEKGGGRADGRTGGCGATEWKMGFVFVLRQ